MLTSTDKLVGRETDKLTFTIGITEGYFHNNEKFVYYYFNPDIPSWRKAAVALVKLLKKELKQSTVIAEFSQVDMLYLNNEN